MVVEKARFNYRTETWERDSFELPYSGDDHVILTPMDMLTKDDTWINKSDLVHDYDQIAESVSNEQLRAQLNNYFRIHLAPKASDKERNAAVAGVYRTFPRANLEYFIRF